MKPTRIPNPFFRPIVANFGTVLLMTLSSPIATGATINKANTTTDLNLPASWTGGAVPGANDVAAWTSTVASANTTQLGADLTWQGISLTSPGGLVTVGGGNVLTLGTSGIDMSAATQSLTIASSLTLGAGGRPWIVAGGQTLALNTGTFIRSIGSTLNLQGSGTVSASMTGLSNEGTTGILGPWASIGTGAATGYATLSTGNLVSFTTGTNVSGAALTNPGDVNTNYNITTASTTTYGAATRQGNTFRLTVGATTLTMGNSASQINLVTNGLMNAGTGLLTVTSGGTNANSGIMVGANNGRELVVNAANNSLSLGRIIDNVGGASSLTTIGSGANTVTLTGVNLYTGETTIAGGTVVLSGTGSVNTSSGITINGANAKFVRTSTTVGTAPITVTRGTLDGTSTAGAVTVGNGSGGIITNGNGGAGQLTLASLVFNGAATLSPRITSGVPGIIVSGALTTTPANGTITVNPSGAFLPGDTTLVTSANPLTLGDFTLGTVTGINPRATRSLEVVGNDLVLNVGSADGIIWTGTNGSVWTTGTTGVVGATPNWALETSHTRTDFWAGDDVQFNDTVNINGSTVAAINTTSIDITGSSVSPLSATFNNSVLDYKIGSVGGFGITGPGTLTLNGTKTVTLTSANTYTGTTIINPGSKLQLGDGATDGTIASTSGVLNDGVLAYNWAGSHTAPYTIIGAGSLVKQGTGTLTLSNATSTFTGGTTISAGAVVANGAALSGGDISIANGGTLTFSGGTNTSSITGAGAINNNLAGVVVFTGDHSGFTGNFTQNGANNTQFNSATAGNPGASYSNLNGEIIFALNGDYTVKFGSLSSAAGATVRGGNTATGTTTVEVGALNTDTVLLGSLNNGTTKVIGLTKVGTGKLTLAATNNYSSATTISAGTLQLGNGTTDGTLTATSGVINNAALIYNWIADHTAAYVVSGTGALTKQGAGKLTLTAEPTYTGNTTISGGAISVAANSATTFADTSTITITTGAVLDLPNATTDVVASLVLNGVAQSAGIYDSSTPGGYITGLGKIQVGAAVPGYAAWALANAPGQTKDQDHDNDGIKNGIEYFSGFSGSGFNPGGNGTLSGATATWIKGGSYTGTYGADFLIQSSTDLVNWVTVPVGTDPILGTVANNAGSVTYTPVTGQTKRFGRLVVRN